MRASVEAQIKEAERARTFAWRRLSALSDMARVAALEPDRELAVERQLEALFREIGWIEGGLAELGDGAPGRCSTGCGRSPRRCMPRRIRQVSRRMARPAEPPVSPIRSRPFVPSRPGTRPSAASRSCRSSIATCRRRRSSNSRAAMKTDFEHWLAAQFADTGRSRSSSCWSHRGDGSFLKSSYAHLIGDDMPWPDMRPARRPGRPGTASPSSSAWA